MDAEYEKIDHMVRTSLDIGEHMLMNGADVSRVEDTVTRICNLYEVKHIEVFCIATLLQASVRLNDGRYCYQMRRVKSNQNNLARLEELNSISRKLCNREIDMDQAEAMVKAANKLEPYRSWPYYLAAVAGASAFCIFFGGSLRDGLCAAIAAVPVMFMDMHQPKRSMQLVNTIFESFVGGAIANLLTIAGLGQNVNLICVGVLMLLIPGVMFGNAMQDYMRADVLAGTAKLVHAILLTMMIVLGLGAAMFIFGKWII